MSQRGPPWVPCRPCFHCPGRRHLKGSRQYKRGCYLEPPVGRRRRRSYSVRPRPGGSTRTPGQLRHDGPQRRCPRRLGRRRRRSGRVGGHCGAGAGAQDGTSRSRSPIGNKTSRSVRDPFFIIFPSRFVRSRRHGVRRLFRQRCQQHPAQAARSDVASDDGQNIVAQQGTRHAE